MTFGKDIILQIRRLSFKAILWGVLADTIGTLAVATALFLAMAAAGIPDGEITVRMRGFGGLMLMLIFGLSFTLIGGYVAGRTAGRVEMLHGAFVAGVGLVLGLFLREPGLPLWYETISFAAMIPIGMAGGYFAREGNVKGNLPEKK
ncbi:MAG TPA: hypothetical protein VLN91_01220 [Nitrospirota bacterium]|nr:hypothetical protein [Nitrospirota bacterium]